MSPVSINLEVYLTQDLSEVYNITRNIQTFNDFNDAPKEDKIPKQTLEYLARWNPVSSGF